MFKVLKWICTIISFVIFASIIGLVIFIQNFDLNTYKQRIEKIVYEQTGRVLSLNGDAGLKLSLVPTIEVNDVTLSNAKWADKTPMVKVKKADVSLGLIPLLKKDIEIEEINLIEPVVNLAVNAQGEGNWVFEKPLTEEEKTKSEKLSQSEENKSEPKVENAAAAPLAFGIVAKKLYIEKGVINYADLKSKSQMKVDIKSLELDSENMDSEINLKYDVVYNGTEVKGSAVADSINTLLKNDPYHVNISTKAYGATVKAQALLSDLMGGNIKYDASLNAQNPAGNFDLPKTDLIAKVAGDLKIVNATVEKLDMGGNVLNGKVKVDISAKKPSITGSIASKVFNVMLLKAPEKTAFVSVVSPVYAASFVPNEKLDLSALDSVNANIKFNIGQLILNEDIDLTDLTGTLALQNGVLNVKPLSFKAGGGPLNGDLSLNSAGNVLNLNLDGTDITIQDFLKNLAPKEGNFAFLNGGKTDLHIALKSNGETYPKLVENLKGQVLLVIGQSRLQAGALKYIKGNFISQLLSALHLQAKEPTMSMKCAVLRGDFADGKIKLPKGLAFDSKKMTIVGDGTVNLVNDKLDISIKPFNGSLTDVNIAQAISSLVKIGGTITNPGIRIDNASVVKNVVGVAMTGPAFVGSQLLLDADPAPCYTALKETKYANMFEAPKGVKAGAQGAYQGTSDLVEGSLNLVTGAAGNIVEGGTDLIGNTAKGIFNMLGGSKKKKE